MIDNHLVKNTTIYALGDIIPRLLSFISFPILTRYLTPADYGIVSYVNTINTFLVIISTMCLNTYYLVYYYRQRNEKEQAQLLGNLSIFVITFNILFSGAVFICGTKLFNAIGSNIEFYPYIAIGIATNFFSILSVLPMALYRVQERPLPLTMLNIFKGASTFVLTLLLVVHYQYTALGVLYAGLIVSAFFGVIFLCITNKYVVWHIDKFQLAHALRFSLPLMPGALAYYCVSWSDRIFIDKYMNLNDLGIYSTASTIALLLNIVVQGSYKAFEPYFFRIYGTEQFWSEFVKIKDGYLFILLSGALCLSVFAKEFFEFFAGEEYRVAYLYVAPILVGVVVSAMVLIYSTILCAQDKTKMNSIIAIVGGAVSIGLNFILVKRWGLLAACFASATSMWIMLELSEHGTGLKLSRKRSGLAVLLSGCCAIFSVYLLNVSNIWLSILIKFVLVAITIWGLTKIFRLPIHFFWRMALDKIRNI